MVFAQCNKDNLYCYGDISLIQYSYEFYFKKQKRCVYKFKAGRVILFARSNVNDVQ